MFAPRFGRSAGIALVLFVVLVTVSLAVSHLNGGNGVQKVENETGEFEPAISAALNDDSNRDGGGGGNRQNERQGARPDRPEGEAPRDRDAISEQSEEGAAGSADAEQRPGVLGVGGPIGTESGWPGELRSVESDRDEGAGDGASEVEEEPEEPTPPNPIEDYVVQPGDSVWTIARAYGVDVDTVAAANGLVHVDRIRPGEKLIVPTERGVVYEVEEGEALSVIARRYDVNVRDIVDVNGLRDANRVRTGQMLLLPGATPRPPGELVVWNGKLQPVFRRPVAGGWISSPYGRRWGRMHAGIDIAVVNGTPVRAAVPGVVSFSGRNGGYGNLVVIDHGSGVETRYGHNSRLVVRAGQRVKTGQIVAYSGNTGNSTGPHVHFEIRRHGRPVNPLLYLYD